MWFKQTTDGRYSWKRVENWYLALTAEAHGGGISDGMVWPVPDWLLPARPTEIHKIWEEWINSWEIMILIYLANLLIGMMDLREAWRESAISEKSAGEVEV